MIGRRKLRRAFDAELRAIADDVLAEVLVDVERYGLDEQTAVARGLEAFDERTARFRTPAEIELAELRAQREAT